MFNGIPCPAAVNANVHQNACAANTTVTDTVAVPGARVGDFVVVTPNGAVDIGMMFGAGRVSVAGTVEVPVMNTTAGALPAGAAGINYSVLVLPRD